MPLGDLFRESFAGRRNVVGLEYEDAGGAVRPLTFGEIDARANRMARALTARGLQRGDRLCVYLANTAEFIDLFLASLRIGAIFVPVNVLYRERELAHIIGDAAPKLTVTSAEIEALSAEAAAQSDAPIVAAVSDDDPAAVIYTSGTTGRSKGAVLSHANFIANTNNVVGEWRITGDDRYLAVLPLFHVHGLANGVCSWLAVGSRMRLVARFEHARAADLFESFQPTLFFGVPTIYMRLLDLQPDTALRIGKRMRLFVSGSAPLPAHVFDAFRERYGHAILERYGMSETLMLMSNPYDGERRSGTVGMPLPHVSVRVAESGELHVRGPNVFRGYWSNDQATAAAFDEGWFRTGDLAERSADGYYTLRGRTTDLIITGGFNVYPREIEEVLLEQPGVREAAVVGVPDELRGEVPVAYLVTDSAVDADALRAACLRALASFKLPRSFTRVDSLPRNALGKVQRHLLTARNDS